MAVCGWLAQAASASAKFSATGVERGFLLVDEDVVERVDETAEAAVGEHPSFQPKSHEVPVPFRAVCSASSAHRPQS